MTRHFSSRRAPTISLEVDDHGVGDGISSLLSAKGSVDPNDAS